MAQVVDGARLCAFVVGAFVVGAVVLGVAMVRVKVVGPPGGR